MSDLDHPLYAKDINLHAYFKPNVRQPETIAECALNLVDRLSAIDPLLANWTLYESRDRESESATTPFETIRGNMAAVVDRNKSITEGTGGVWIQEFDGYFILLINNFSDRSPQRLGVSISTGHGYNNCVSITTSWWGPADPTLLRFEVVGAIVYAACETFGAMFATVSQGRRDTLPNLPGHFRPASMTYLGPAGAALVTPPPGIVVERRPDGGLLMATTRERFDAGNSNHIAAVRAIHSACAPYNALAEPI